MPRLGCLNSCLLLGSHSFHGHCRENGRHLYFSRTFTEPFFHRAFRLRACQILSRQQFLNRLSNHVLSLLTLMVPSKLVRFCFGKS